MTAANGIPAADRWRLHRGGIVNIWQYDEQEFDFSGGRAVFQGTNGSGKSRTLELLLPLCLDGDLRQLGSKGFDTVSIRRLMLDDYDGGPNRIGYAWVELRRLDETGADHYLTCGLGLKASATAQQVSDSWRFITDARIGVDVHLAGPDRVPLGQAQLREEIGADRVLDEGAFRAGVAELVYGMPAGRYGDLLHLQRTLRNPDVGLKVLEGQLEQILSDALPPLDASMIEQLGTSFEDLESIRENINRLSTADTALSAFLSSYSGYALAALRTAAERARGASSALAAEQNEQRQLAARLEQQTAKHAAAVAEVAADERRDGELENTIDSLKELPAYQGLRDLGDRERLVAQARAAAAGALETATKHRTHADRAVETVLSVLRRLGQDTSAASELAELARRQLSAAGLDANLCPRVPHAPGATPGAVTELVRAKPDPEAAPLEIERRVPPEVHPEALETELRTAAARAEQVAGVVGQRAALTLSLTERAVDLDRQGRALDALRQSARQAQLEATESAGRRNEAGQRRIDAAADWRERALAWTTSGPFADAGRPVQPPSLEELIAGAEQTRAVQESAREWAAPRLHALRQAVVTAQQRVDAVAARTTAAEAELITLRGGVAADPPPPPYATADRDPAAGAPFHRLVDFAPDVPEPARAGLEAALQASGLLAAWVRADGTLADAPVADLFARPSDGSTVDGPLGDLLVPAVEPGCPVPVDLVRGLLASVSTAVQSTAGMAIGTDGRWRAGVLSGGLTKPAAEFVGAGAREAARARRTAELVEQIEALTEERAVVDDELTGHSERVAAWDRHLAAFPDDRALITAHATLATAVRSAEEATAKAARLRAELDQADQRNQAAQIELAQTAAEAGLPADVETLQRANAAASAARTSAEQLRDTMLGRCLGSVRDLADALHDHQAAMDDLGDATTAAEAQCAEFGGEAAALAELTSAVGGEAQRVAGQLSTLDKERRALRAALPGRRTAATDLSNQVVKTETVLEGKVSTIEAKAEAQRAALAGFRAAVAAPGVCSAALPEPEPLPDDPGEALAVLAAVDQRPASEETVITKLQALQSALAGSHEITPERTAGILTIVVIGEQGPRPVAEAARAVSAQLGEQRGYLGERYQDIFATFMLRNLAERLHGQISVAEDLAKRMNDMLDVARSSQGVHVQLEWRPSAALDETTLEALKLVRMPFAERTPEQDETLRRAFTERIDAQRDANSGGYAEILTRALDYRSWYTFTVRVGDSGPDGKPRTRRMRQLSSGETRLVSYVTLFAAAAAFYSAVSGSAGTAGDEVDPLRLVLLDEAFERLDDPTIARMLGLLVDLDMDWIITWPSGWGVSEKIPRMHIYDVLRPKSGRGVACTHTVWDGADLAHTED
ncbi:MAG TPA: TIGR02680 family protein [Pseudonocardiaceae bacterium]|jgi:uncharacterized protein (TIGR02680 family)|nr:TIGR02680 family protein [Pseudonocardiaceae bacterium]